MNKSEMNSRNYPLISIITPSYNQGQFIEKTIKSVLSQEGDFYIDYIIMDGSSTDNSVQIIEKYESSLKERKWPIKCRGIQYRWVSEKDRGQSDAINKGFGMAKGEIFAWLNSDDTYLPGAFKKAAEFFKSHHDVGVVYGMSHFIDETDNIIDNYPTESFDYKRLASFNFISQPSTFFKKNVYYEVGGLDIGLQFAFDYDLWIRMAYKFKIEYLPEFLATYRLHEESKSVFEHSAIGRDREALEIALKYYHWAPANRVYGYCYHLIKSKIPASLVRVSPVVFLLTFIMSCKEYLKLNRGIRLDDIKLINIENIKKLFGRWELKDKIRTF